MTEDDKAFHVQGDLPGVDKKDIKVTADQGVLRISVEKESEKEEDKEEAGVKVRVRCVGCELRRACRAAASPHAHPVRIN